MPQIAGAGPAAGTESGKHIATAQQMWHERAWTRALSAGRAGTALVRPANTAPSTSPTGKGSGTTPRQPFCRSATPAFSPLPGAGDTHRWDREVTSAKMPSGRLEMSLPWRDLRRAGGPVIPAPPGPLRVTGGRGDSAGRRAGLGQALTAGAGSAAPRRPAAGCTAGSCSSGSCAREGGGHTARRAPREAAASCTPATPHPAPRHPQQLGHPFIQVEEEILVSPSTFGVPYGHPPAARGAHLQGGELAHVGEGGVAEGADPVVAQVAAKHRAQGLGPALPRPHRLPAHPHGSDVRRVLGCSQPAVSPCSGQSTGSPRTSLPSWGWHGTGTACCGSCPWLLTQAAGT